MEFDFTKEQRQVADAARTFAQKELLPGYAQRDREKKFSRDIWKKLGDLGFLGMSVPIEDGGIGSDYVSQGIACEEMGKGDPNVCTSAFVVGELCSNMMAPGTKKIKEKYLIPMIEGKSVVAFALTEPHCGTDAGAMTTSAVKKGSAYIINGEKSGITMITEADATVFFARTDPNLGARGISAFVLSNDLPGISRQSYDDLGGKSLARGSIFFDNVEIPVENLLGKEGEGFKLGMQSFDISRIYLSLACLGAAEASLKETIAYTKERHAFKKPLARFEGVSFTIVEHLSLIEAVRLLCYKALWLIDNGKSSTKEAAMVKWMAPRFSVNAIHDCLLLHGHYGYTDDLPLEQRLRDVMGIEIADGTSQVSKIVAGREVFGREYLPY